MEIISTIIAGIIGGLIKDVLRELSSLAGDWVKKERPVRKCLESALQSLADHIEGDQERKEWTLELFGKFFKKDPRWMAQQMVPIFQKKELDVSAMETRFRELGLDPDTLPGIRFQIGIKVFEKGFLEAAAAESSLQPLVMALQSGEQLNELKKIVAAVQSEDEILDQFLREVSSRVNGLPWAPIHEAFADADKNNEFRLNEIYTDLKTTDHPKFEQEAEHQYRQYLQEKKGTDPITVLQAVEAAKALVILGDPGSGKSTFLKFLSYSLAQAGLVKDGEQQGLKRLDPWSQGALVPIWVELKQFAEYISKKSVEAEGESFRSFLHQLFKNWKQPAFVKWFESALAGKVPVLFLLDGLYEASSTTIPKMVEQINAFARRFSQHRYLVSCRPYALIGQKWSFPGFQLTTLAPFDSDQVDQFLKIGFPVCMRKDT